METHARVVLMSYPKLLVAVLLLSGCGGGGGGNSSSATIPNTTAPTASPSPSPAPTPTPAPPLTLGSRDDLLFWTPDQQRDGYRNMELVFPTRSISRSSNTAQPVFALPSAPVDLSNVRYQYRGVTYTLADFIANNRVAGLLVLKNGQIAYEHYEFGHRETSKWTSFSVAKSVVSLMVGVAIREGSITSVNDLVTKYLPQLSGTAYDGVTLKNLLQMSSGVQWNEDYADPQSDVARVGAAMRQSGNDGLIAYMAARPRVAVPGKRFNYSTGETHLVGALLAAAVHENLSSYLSRKLWSRFAMESDGFWVTSTDNGSEVGGCCMSATLRDYGRIGQFVLRNGVLADGTQIVPSTWIADSTITATSTTDQGASPGYGYLWWLTGGGNFAAVGIFGQTIQIYPQQQIVIVMQSFWPVSGDPDLSGHRAAVSTAIRAVIG